MDNRSGKNRSEPARPVNRSSRLLAGLLAVSAAANVVLGTMLWRTSSASPAEKVTASAPAPTPVPSRPAGDPVLSRDLRPYAALGTFVAENNKIPALQWTPEQFAAFQTGMRSSYEGRGFPVDDDAVKLREAINAKVQAMMGAQQQDPVEQYFATLREKEGVKGLPSGLHYRITQEGQGAKAGSDDNVVVSYAARLPGGQSLPMLSRARVRSAVRDLLPGMAEGVQLLNPGGKALIYLPPALSFKEGPWPDGVPKGAPIIFFVELHEVTPAE
jgi:FKBP-type peptidyl-prolyl cis-trans isomerase FkpA